MATERHALVEALLGLSEFVGPAPRWGAELSIAANAVDPPSTILGETAGNLGSVQLPAPLPLNVRWGYWKPAPFAIPGLTLPAGGGGRFRPMLSTGGVIHHDAFRVLMEWGIPNGVQMRQWIGPNQIVSVSAQQLTLRLYRMRATTLDVKVKSMIGLGNVNPEWNRKCVNSTRTQSAELFQTWTQVVGSNWARRGGHVACAGDLGCWVSFAELSPAPATADGYFLEGAAFAPGAPKSVPIPVDWCGPVWAMEPTNTGGEVSVQEHWTSPPEMEPWAATP